MSIVKVRVPIDRTATQSGICFRPEIKRVHMQTKCTAAKEASVFKVESIL
jgi:hypothetical protein